MRKLKNNNPDRHSVLAKKAIRGNIESLIFDLTNKDGIVRIKARRQLVAYKAQSVPYLIKSLSDGNDWVRWEAAKALGQIGDPSSIQALIKALLDERIDIRWLAAEGLIRIGRKAIVPLLEELVSNSDSSRLREGIHHVLHDTHLRNLGKISKPVLIALEGPEPALEVPIIARSVLESLTKKSSLR
jgi:HEAT repeat protein